MLDTTVKAWTPCSNLGCLLCNHVRRDTVKYTPYILHHHRILSMDGTFVYNERLCECAAWTAMNPAGSWPSFQKIEAERLVITHNSDCRCASCVKRKLRVYYGNDAENERAKEFFREHLTPWQKYTMSTRGYVDVLAQDGRKWRLDVFASSGNAWQWVDKNEWAKRWGPPVPYWQGFCVVVYARVPACDQFLAQLLALRSNPDAFYTAAEGYETAQIPPKDIVSRNYWGYYFLTFPFASGGKGKWAA